MHVLLAETGDEGLDRGQGRAEIMGDGSQDGGAYRIDLVRHTAVTLPDEAPARLTPIEWAIVEHLVRNPDRLVTQRQLINTVWSPSYDPDPTLVRVHLQHIRRKLEPNPEAPLYFVTEPGLGVRFLPDGA